MPEKYPPEFKRDVAVVLAERTVRRWRTSPRLRDLVVGQALDAAGRLDDGVAEGLPSDEQAETHAHHHATQPSSMDLNPCQQARGRPGCPVIHAALTGTVVRPRPIGHDDPPSEPADPRGVRHVGLVPPGLPRPGMGA